MRSTKSRFSLFRVIELIAIVCLATVTIAGCSGGAQDDLIPATGTVTQDGRPLAGVNVTFMPKEGKGAPSGGQTDGEGKFELQYADGRPGAVLGNHRVVITIPGSEAPPPLSGTQPPPKPTKPAEFFKQADVQEAGDNHFSFELAG